MANFFPLLLLFLTFRGCQEEEYLPNTNSSTEIEEQKAASGWQTIFWDGFDTFNGDNWTKTGGRTDYNSSITTFVPWLANVITKDNGKVVHLKAEKGGSTAYRGGHVKSKRKFISGFGEGIRITFRAKMEIEEWDYSLSNFNKSYGAWTALWSTEEYGWPTKGEIDEVEGFSKLNNTIYYSNMFYGVQVNQNQMGTSLEVKYPVDPGNSAPRWHNYEIYWKKYSGGWNEINIFVDNNWKKGY